MPATLATRRRCPHCGATFALGDCPVVATNFEQADQLYFSEVRDFEFNQIKLPSKTVPLRPLAKTHWPVLAEPLGRRRAARRPQRRRAYLEVIAGSSDRQPADEPLPPLLNGGLSWQDLPARACPTCEMPLPQTIDDRDPIVIAVVGVNRAGKTHLLASSLTVASRQRGLARIGCTDFVADECCIEFFLERFFRPLFREQELIGETPAEEEERRFRPLVFNATLRGHEPFSVVIHDISGEVLADHRRRAAAAPYLRAARGVIFVVDPLDVDGIRDGVPEAILANTVLGGWDQSVLLAGLLRGDGALNGRTVPIAVTVTKADLLPLATSEAPSFMVPAEDGESAEEFVARIKRSSDEVAAFLSRHGGESLIDAAEEYERRLQAAGGARVNAVTYHAVSALGRPPQSEQELGGKPDPINCVDPLATLLVRLSTSMP